MLHLFYQLSLEIEDNFENKVTATLAASLPSSHRWKISPGYQRLMLGGAGLVFEDSIIFPSGTGLSWGDTTWEGAGNNNIASIKPNTQKS